MRERKKWKNYRDKYFCRWKNKTDTTKTGDTGGEKSPIFYFILLISTRGVSPLTPRKKTSGHDDLVISTTWCTNTWIIADTRKSKSGLLVPKQQWSTSNRKIVSLLPFLSTIKELKGFIRDFFVMQNSRFFHIRTQTPINSGLMSSRGSV